MPQEYDVIVVGCGGYGSAALYWLARRIGGRALGLEQFVLGHHKGSSQDHSRVIRHTYHDAAYTRLTRHAFATWAKVEAESAVKLVHKTGGVWIVYPDQRDQLDTYARALEAADIPYARGGAEVTMETRTFEPDTRRAQWLYEFLSQRIPHFVGPTLYTKTCLYAFAPDDDFVLGALPEHDNILVAYTGGHGFKFASLMGKILSQLALDGRTAYPIDRFAPTRAWEVGSRSSP